MRALLWLPVFFAAGLTLYFGDCAYNDFCNPHLMGITTSHGERVPFRDNGDRFSYGVLQGGIALFGAITTVRLVRIARAKPTDADRRYGLD